MRITITDDEEKREAILKALKDNDNYCPCRVDKVEANRCICDEFLNQQETGECLCGLYTKTE